MICSDCRIDLNTQDKYFIFKSKTSEHVRFAFCSDCFDTRIKSFETDRHAAQAFFKLVEEHP